MKNKSKVTIGKLLDYGQVGNGWLQANPDNSKTKLGYAMMRTKDATDKALEPYRAILREVQRKVEDIQLDFAMTDSTGKLMKRQVQEGGRTIEVYDYTKDDQKKMNNALRTLQDEYDKKLEDLKNQEVEIEAYYATEVPSTKFLSEYEKEIFTGIVIDPIPNHVASLGELRKLEATDK